MRIESVMTLAGWSFARCSGSSRGERVRRRMIVARVFFPPGRDDSPQRSVAALAVLKPLNAACLTPLARVIASTPPAQ